MANSNENITLPDSDEMLELCCDLCSKNGIRNAEVDGFCSDCVQYFCAACVRFHQILLPLHKQLNKHDMPKDICTDVCTMHNDDMIKFNCKNCEEFICSKCKTENHGQCNEVHFLPLLVKDIENSRELTDFVSILNQFETKLDNTKASINDKLTSIDVMRGETLDTLNQHKLEIQNTFIIETEQLDIMIQTISDEDKVKTEKDMEHVASISKSFNLIKQELNDRRIAGQRCKLYTTLIKSKPTMSKLEQELQDVQQKISMTKYKYKPKNYTVKIQDIGEIEINGELLKTGSKNLFSERDGNHHDIKVLREGFSNTTRKYKECKRHCIKMGSVFGMIIIAFWLGTVVLQGSFELQVAVKIQTVDMPRGIATFCILDDHTLAAIGKSSLDGVLIIKHNNLINLIHISYNTLWAIVNISPTKVAITIPDTRQIEIYEIDSDNYRIHIERKLRIHLERYPYEIDYFDEKMFVETYSEATQQTYLEVFNLEGLLLNTIRFESYSFGPFKMAFETSKDYKEYLAYVLDMDNKVIGLKIHEDTYQSVHNFTGKCPTFYFGLYWKIKEDSFRPTAITTDMEGHVYVCCDEENNIYKISPDLKTATVVLGTDRDMPKPTSMVYKFNKLYIASAQNNIRVFDIQKSNWLLY